MIMAPRPDPTAAEHARFERLPDFQLECKSWAEFVQKMEAGGEFFAFRLMRQPRHQEPLSMAGNPEWTDRIFFGFPAKRSDGKLGRLCFGEFMESVDEGRSKHVLKILNGFSKQDLWLMPESQDEIRAFFQIPRYTPSKMSLLYRGAEAESQFVRWLENRVGQLHEEEEDELSVSRAADLKLLRFVMRQVFPDRSKLSDDVKALLELLDEKIRKHAGVLAGRRTKVALELARLDAEIAELA